MPLVLAGGRLGTAGVLSFALAAAAPLTVVAAGVPAAYAAGVFVPLVLLAAGLILLVFSVGYTTMIRRAPTVGSLYTVVARGLGRPLGIGAAWVALLSYNMLQIGLYGAVGPVLTGWFGVTVPWWQVALACWVVVALLGLLSVGVVGRLLAVIVIAETVVIAGFSAASLLAPPGGRITAPTISLVDRPAIGLLLIGAALAFVGFETAAAYGEEARRPRRAIGRATYLAVLLLVVLYTGGAWAMSVGAGADLAAVADARGPELMFDLAAARLAPWAVTLGRIVLLTGLVAAMIALHQTIARYVFALGRDRVLPALLGRTTRRALVPRAASLTQTLVAGLVIGGYAFFDFDPQTRMARRLGASGSFGVLLLLVAASLAAVVYLNRAPGGVNVWRRLFAPGLATVAFGTLSSLAFVNLADLLGVQAGDPLTLIVPGAFGAAVLLGLCFGLILRKTRPALYAGIGLGDTAAVVSPMPAPAPAERMPGAHRRRERINRGPSR